MNIKHILRKDGENDIKLRARIKKEHQNADLSKTIERLQEQLNDANDIIDFYFPKIKKIHSVCIEPLKLYRKKWGVK